METCVYCGRTRETNSLVRVETEEAGGIEFLHCTKDSCQDRATKRMEDLPQILLNVPDEYQFSWKRTVLPPYSRELQRSYK